MKPEGYGNKHKFEALMHECELHAQRIEQARATCKVLFPLNPDTYTALGNDSITHIDQLVYRFTKLQDTLGAKFFPALAAILREDAVRLTLFDVLYDLEKRDIIPSAEQWISLREIRNQIAHDYENNPDTGSYYLNEVFDKSSTLVEICRQVIAYTRSTIIPSLKHF